MRYLFQTFTPATSRHTLKMAQDFRGAWGEAPLSRGLCVSINVHEDDARIENVAPGTFVNQVLDALFAAGVLENYRLREMTLTLTTHAHAEGIGAFVKVEGYRGC